MKYLLGLTLISSIFFLVFPEFDLAVSQAFYSPEHGFMYKDHPLVLGVYNIIPIFTKALIVFFVIQLLLKRFKPNLKCYVLSYRATLFLFLALILGPGVLIHNIVKEVTGRPRPDTIVIFGGKEHYQPPIAISDTGGKSFVSGHAAMGFYLAAFTFVSMSRKSKIAWYSSGLLAGSIVGLGRILQGRHFFSDIWFSGLIVLLTCHALYYILFTVRQKP